MLENVSSFDQKTWDNKIMVAVKAGKIKERKDLIPKGFLYVYQVFNSVLEEDGKLYRVSAWAHPQNETVVDVTPYIKED